MSFHKPVTHSLLESQHLIGLSHKKVYLAYIDEEPHWWSKPFKTGYKHVFAVIFDGLFWIKMDLTLGFTEIDILCYDQYDTINDIMKEQDAIIQYVEVWRERRYRVRSLFAPYTCVEAMKSLLGLRAWWVITPYQLYKHMRQYNGNVRNITKASRANHTSGSATRS